MTNNNPITLGSLFSGSGGFELAGIINDITPIWNSEIKPFPMLVTSKNLPETLQLGNISSVNGADIQPVDIITFGSPCFPSGTPVLTDKVYKAIEYIRDYRPDFAFLYLGWPDAAGHGYGWMGEEYMHSIKESWK